MNYSNNHTAEQSELCLLIGSCCVHLGSLTPYVTDVCLHISMLESSNLITFNGLANSSSYDTFLLDEERGRLLVGAEDHIFSFDLVNINRDHKQIAWPATPSKRDECKWAGKDLGKECSNFIRVLQPYNQTHLYICGTGAFHPICAYLEMGKRAEDNIFRLASHFENGRGKSPYDPKMLSASLLIDGELYSGTSADFMGRDFAIFRTLGDHHPIRTEQHDSRWLNDPRFVGVNLIPESDNPEDDKIFLFFKENAMDGEHTGKATIARIGQLCKNDMGGHRSLVNKWTTFLKARLMCSVPGANGIDTHFDELQDVFLMSSKDPKNPVIYAVFTTSSNIFKGSAVCMYNMADIRRVFLGPYAHRDGPNYQWVPFQGRVPYPRPGTYLFSHKHPLTVDLDRGFTPSCKPLVSLKSRKTRLDFAKNIEKSLPNSGAQFFGQMKQRLTCTRMMGRAKCGELKEQLMNQSIAHHLSSMVEAVLWHGHVWLLLELGH
uniref:Sema domain, immunoglobulin domain (Ig), short basic domain, secreted, (semaphorin) 3Aa n=1 Tax=Myripristis murdjan TaxID=586833 RepID=A0A667ZZ47_9TELE